MLRAEDIALLERGRELELLNALVRDLRAGAGRAVITEGPAGIGKTALLHQLRGLAEGGDILTLGGRGTELERDFAFGLVRQVFEPHLRTLAPRHAASLLRGPASLTEPLLGRGGGFDPPASGDPAFPLLHGLYWLLANIADECPVLLLLDDVQWADTQSVRFIEFLAPRLAELPVGVVLARRTGEIEDENVSAALERLRADPDVETLRPAHLSRGAIAELVEAEFDRPSTEAFLDACAEATGGNPFLVRELLRELRTEGLEPGDATATGISSMAPETVSRSVIVRLARLSEPARGLARALAVLGDRTDLATAALLAGLSHEESAALGDALARIDIIQAGRPVSFTHPLVRNAIYQELEPAQRSAMHRSAAKLLAEAGAEPERIASHLLRTEPALDAQVVETLREAARLASARGASAAAAKYLRRAVIEPPPPDVRLPLERELVSAAVAAGEAAALPEFLDGAIAELEADPHELALAAPDLALALISFGRPQDGHALLTRAIEGVAPIDAELALRLEAELITLSQWDERTWRDAVERMRRFRASPPRGDTLGEQLILANLAHLLGLNGDFDAATTADLAERALRDGALVTTYGADRIQVVQAIRALIRAERLDVASDWADRARTEARIRGLPVGFALNSVYKAQAEFLRCEVATAAADARTAFDIARSGGWAGVAGTVPGTLMEILLERGDVAEAQRTLDESGVAEDLSLTGHAIPYVLLSRGRMKLAQGLTEDGLKDLFAAGDALERLYGRRHVAAWPWAAVASPVLAQLGREDDARLLIEEELDAMGEWGSPGWIAVSLRARGEVTGGGEGLQLLEQGVERARASALRLELARSLVALGSALRRAGRRADARAPLNEALDVARRGGAIATASRARDELEATGERVSRELAIGADALTPSERRIATLAAEGMTNPQIAQSLFVTVKTVEAHLRNAYRKLDISSRKELPKALAGEP